MPALPPKHNPFPKSKARIDRERKERVDLARKNSPVRKWYYTNRWKRRRAEKLERDPFCACGAKATHADHVPPHKGDEWQFFNGPLKSKCASCHNRATARYDGGFGNPIRPRPPE